MLYPTTKSRLLAAIGLLICGSYFLLPAVHTNVTMRSLMLAIAMIALGSSYKTRTIIGYRAPASEGERVFVARLKLLKSAGLLLFVAGGLWLLAVQPVSDRMRAIPPLATIAISLILQGVATVLYTPFLVPNTEFPPPVEASD